MACFAYSLSWWSSLSYLHLIIQSTEFSLFILSTALLFSLFHSHEMDFFKWLWENYVFFEIFIINLEIKENKRRRFLSWQNRGKENEKKKKKRGCCCSVISYWTSVCQKSKQIDLFAILRKRFCLHEFSDSGHKIRNRNFINIPNLRKLFFICLKYIWDVLNTKSSISSDTGKGSQFWAVSQTWAVFRVDFSINSQMIEETTRLGRKRRKRYNKNKIIHHWRQD